jgi:hypothetical protein
MKFMAQGVGPLPDIPARVTVSAIEGISRTAGARGQVESSDLDR